MKEYHLHLECWEELIFHLFDIHIDNFGLCAVDYSVLQPSRCVCRSFRGSCFYPSSVCQEFGGPGVCVRARYSRYSRNLCTVDWSVRCSFLLSQCVFPSADHVFNLPRCVESSGDVHQIHTVTQCSYQEIKHLGHLSKVLGHDIDDLRVLYILYFCDRSVVYPG